MSTFYIIIICKADYIKFSIELNVIICGFLFIVISFLGTSFSHVQCVVDVWCHREIFVIIQLTVILIPNAEFYFLHLLCIICLKIWSFCAAT